MATERQLQEMRELEYRLRLRQEKMRAIHDKQTISAPQQVAMIANICIGATIVMLLLLIFIEWLK